MSERERNLEAETNRLAIDKAHLRDRIAKLEAARPMGAGCVHCGETLFADRRSQDISAAELKAHVEECLGQTTTNEAGLIGLLREARDTIRPVYTPPRYGLVSLHDRITAALDQIDQAAPSPATCSPDADERSADMPGGGALDSEECSDCPTGECGCACVPELIESDKLGHQDVGLRPGEISPNGPESAPGSEPEQMDAPRSAADAHRTSAEAVPSHNPAGPGAPPTDGGFDVEGARRLASDAMSSFRENRAVGVLHPVGEALSFACDHIDRLQHNEHVHKAHIRAAEAALKVEELPPTDGGGFDLEAARRWAHPVVQCCCDHIDRLQSLLDKERAKK